MERDAFDLFGKTYRIYVQGVRNAIRERLETQYGGQWWEQGVLASFHGQYLDEMSAAAEGIDDATARANLLDNRHFGYIIRKHHQQLFAQAFPDSLRAFSLFRKVTTVRNDWAHVRDVSFGRYRQSTIIMRDVLANLGRQEATQITNVGGENVVDSTTELPQELIEESDIREGVRNSSPVLTEPVDNWRRLQEYLRVDQQVEIARAEANQTAVISFAITNTAPDSPDWPSVVFKNIFVQGKTGRTEPIEKLRPGEAQVVSLQVPEERLLTFDVVLSAEVDGEELLQFRHRQELQSDVARGIRERFTADFQEIRIEEFVTRAVETVDVVDKDLNLGELQKVRQALGDHVGEVDRQVNALSGLFEKYRMRRGEALPDKVRELREKLLAFKEAVQDVDAAIGATNLDKLEEVKTSLADAQLAVVRVESEIRSIGGS